MEYDNEFTEDQLDIANEMFHRLDGMSPEWFKEWIRKEGDSSWTLEEVLEMARQWVEEGETTHLPFDSPHVPPEFWEHYQRITRTEVPEEKQEGFFSCAC